MRIIILIFGVLGFWSCANEIVPRPDRVLSLQEMEDIVFDLSILNTAAKVDKASFENVSITPLSYVYKKYEIDSLTYAQNDLYFASRPLDYEYIYRRVEKKLQALKGAHNKKAEIETLN